MTRTYHHRKPCTASRNVHWRGASSGEDEEEGSNDKKSHDVGFEDQPGLNLSWTWVFTTPPSRDFKYVMGKKSIGKGT